MKITQLTLHRYKRFHALKNETFTYSPQDRHTVVVGNSGKGKSSLMYELSPLPANMRDFEEGGYKEIHIVQDKDSYILRSSGKGAGHHEFIRNGTDLNRANNQSEQIRLVEEHFRYTKDIHHLLLGITRFTRMSGNERRDWFQRMTNTDNEFAMRLWDLIRGGQRDNQGAIKNVVAKIAENMSKLIGDQELEDQKKILETYNTALVRLNEIRHLYSSTSYRPDERRYENEVNHLVNILMEKYNQLSNEIIPFSTERYSVPQLEKLISEMDLTLSKNKERSDVIVKEISHLKEEKGKYNFQQDLSDQDIEKFYQNAKVKFDTFQEDPENRNLIRTFQRLQKRFDFSDADVVLRLRDAICNVADHRAILDILLEFKEWEFNHTILEMKELHQQDVIHLKENQTKLTSLQTRIDDLISHRTLLEKEPEHQCPNCRHVFKNKSTEEGLVQIEERLQKSLIQKQKGEEVVTQLQKKVEEDRKYLSLFSNLCSRFYFNPNMEAFLELYYDISELSYEEKIKWYSRNTAIILTTFPMLSQLLEKTITYHQLEERVIHYQKAMDLKLKQAEPAYIGLIIKLETLENEYQGLANQTKELSLARTKYVDLKTKYDGLSSLYQTVETEYGRLIDLMNDHSKSEYQSIINEIARTITEQADKVKQVVEYQHGIKYIISHLEQTQDSLQASIGYHDILMKVINPKDGLIAKSLIGFIRKYISEMNTLIRQVWDYDLIIDIEKDDNFTQKFHFPIKIGTVGRSKDIVETSTGQSEIIDFAFRIIAMKYLKIQGYPLFADELGGALNVSFRNNLFNLIKRLCDENKISQIFIISHLEDIVQQFPTAIIVDFNER